MIDTKAIREAAEAATPGPWEYRELEWGNYVTADGQTSVCRSALSSTASMKHIATANPATVLALCDEIERLKDLLGKANALCRIRADEIERLRTALKLIEWSNDSKFQAQAATEALGGKT